MSEYTCHLFKPKAYEVLHHIHQILEIPHRCQELLSADKTPTLSLVLPMYEMLVFLWKQLVHVLPKLSHYINLGIAKIMEYVSKGHQSRIYALSMGALSMIVASPSCSPAGSSVINPKTNFKWLYDHWSSSECSEAKKWVQEAVCLCGHDCTSFLTDHE